MTRATSWRIWTASCHLIVWERETWEQTGRNYEIWRFVQAYGSLLSPRIHDNAKKEDKLPIQSILLVMLLPALTRERWARAKSFIFFKHVSGESFPHPTLGSSNLHFSFLRHRFYFSSADSKTILTLDWKPQKRRTGEADLIYRMTAIFTSCSFHLRRNAGTCSLISDKEKHKS